MKRSCGSVSSSMNPRREKLGGVTEMGCGIRLSEAPSRIQNQNWLGQTLGGRLSGRGKREKGKENNWHGILTYLSLNLVGVDSLGGFFWKFFFHKVTVILNI